MSIVTLNFGHALIVSPPLADNKADILRINLDRFDARCVWTGVLCVRL